VQRLKHLQRTSDAGKKAWQSWCDEAHQGVRDPNRHEAETLQEFLTWYELEGGLEPADPEKEGLVQRVKELQRSDGVFKEAWAAHCDERHGGRHDPNRQSAADIRSFLSSHNYEVGATKRKRSEAYRPAASTGGTPSEFVVLGSRLSKVFRDAWCKYCSLWGSLGDNPAHYDEAFLREFADYAGQLLQTSLEAATVASEEEATGCGESVDDPVGSEPPAKLPRRGAPKAPSGKGANGQKKVSLRKSVAEEVRRMNAELTVGTEIPLSAVALPLSKLDEATALEILASLADSGNVEDPTAFICEVAAAAHCEDEGSL